MREERPCMEATPHPERGHIPRNIRTVFTPSRVERDRGKEREGKERKGRQEAARPVCGLLSGAGWRWRWRWIWIWIWIWRWRWKCRWRWRWRWRGRWVLPPSLWHLSHPLPPPPQIAGLTVTQHLSPTVLAATQHPPPSPLSSPNGVPPAPRHPLSFPGLDRTRLHRCHQADPARGVHPRLHGQRDQLPGLPRSPPQSPLRDLGSV